MFKSFNFFTADVYNDLSKEMQKIYGNETQHRISYLANNGFSGWLESFEGETLTLNETFSLAQTYMDFGDRKPKDISAVLGSIVHQLDVELPAEAGILTSDYWVNRENVKNSDMTI